MQSRTLGDPAVKATRLARIHDPLIAPLTAFVDRIRRTDDPHALYWAPYFDPKSGGTEAQVLMLLESPGPKVSQTEFVSADNPDQTAENMSCLLKLAGLSLSKVLLWNIFPWQLSAKQVVTQTTAHLREAAPVTRELLTLLPELKVIVLVGRQAEAGWKHAGMPVVSNIKVLACPHPSPLVFIPRPEAASLALSVLGEARQFCNQ